MGNKNTEQASLDVITSLLQSAAIHLSGIQSTDFQFLSTAVGGLQFLLEGIEDLDDLKNPYRRSLGRIAVLLSDAIEREFDRDEFKI